MIEHTSPCTIKALQNAVSPTGKNTSALRIVTLLFSQGPVLSSKINSTCAVANISDIVSKAINPRLEPLGLRVDCWKPLKAVSNRFGEPSGQHYWGLFSINAENDDNMLMSASELKALPDQGVMLTW